MHPIIFCGSPGPSPSTLQRLAMKRSSMKKRPTSRRSNLSRHCQPTSTVSGSIRFDRPVPTRSTGMRRQPLTSSWSGVWEIDALTAAWAVMSGINPERGRIVFETALAILEKDTTILLGWPPLREDTKPYLGRSSWYPEGVRENGMYCHGVQWLVGAARILADYSDEMGRTDDARRYRETADRLWRKISALSHAIPEEI